MIFEFSAVFTCYLTYYKPIAKKDCLARPRARRGRAVRAKWIINIIFEFSAVFTCYLTYYKPITKKSWFGAPGRARGRAESIFNIIFEFSAVFTCYLTYYKPSAKKVGRARRARAGTPVRPQDNFFAATVNLF